MEIMDDIEAGRILPHEEAMAEIQRIRETRRFARQGTGATANV